MTTSNYNPINSVGVYFKNEREQVVGYWKTEIHTPENHKRDFIVVCTIPINSPFQKELVLAVKNRLYEINEMAIYEDEDDDIDPAGGHGLYSHE